MPADQSKIELEIERRGEHGKQTVRLSQTPCNYGGARFWFHCPLCGRRVIKLFCYPHLYQTGTDRRLLRFWCRLCLGLSYASRNCSHDLMTLGQRRAGRIKRKLKADPDELWSHYPDKPKWMRWATYERHMKKFQAAVDLADYGFVASAVRRFPGMFPELEEAST